MSQRDLFKQRRAQTDLALETLERIARLVDAGEPPSAQAATTVAFLAGLEEAAYDASQVSAGEPVLAACVEARQKARVLLQKLKAALDERERGETAAGSVFAQTAREYVQLRREHMELDDRLLSGKTRGANT
ncbi:MAG: hypothetical protein EHM55_00775 [Acidobacteria bacterium]|nr:MAG: hypothetical protein EHM55_00775 [Acidobacteriota bacterium]